MDGDVPLLYCEDISVLELLISYYQKDPLISSMNNNMIAYISSIRNNNKQNILDKAIEEDNEELVVYLVNHGYTNGNGVSLPPGIQLTTKEMNGQEEELQKWQEEEQGEEMDEEDAEDVEMNNNSNNTSNTDADAMDDK